MALNPTAKSAQNTPVTAEGSNPIGGSTHLKDVSKPDGEACCDDGTLKDASEMEWVHSPTQSDTVPHGEKRKQTDSAPDGDVDDIDVLPKTKVSVSQFRSSKVTSNSPLPTVEKRTPNHRFGR